MSPNVQQSTNEFPISPTGNFILIGLAIDGIILCMIFIWEVVKHKIQTMKGKSNINSLKVETSRRHRPPKNASCHDYCRSDDYMECLPLIGPEIINSANEVVKTYNMKQYGEEPNIILVNVCSISNV